MSSRCSTRPAAHLAASGYQVEEVAVPDLDGVWQLWCNLIMTELSALQETQMRQVGSQDFQQTMDGFLEMATILDRDGYMKAIAHRSRMIRDWMVFLETYPVILTPLSVKRTPGAKGGFGRCGAGEGIILERCALHVVDQRAGPAGGGGARGIVASGNARGRAVDRVALPRRCVPRRRRGDRAEGGYARGTAMGQGEPGFIDGATGPRVPTATLARGPTLGPAWFAPAIQPVTQAIQPAKSPA